MRNLIYFTDSSNSSLVIIDSLTNQIINRIKFQNKYVHDIYILDEEKLFYSSEENEIVLYNYKTHKILNKLDAMSIGGSIQFLNVLENIKNLNSFNDLKKFSEDKKIRSILKLENNFRNLIHYTIKKIFLFWQNKISIYFKI